MKRSPKRLRLAFTPTWKGEIEGYARKFTAKEEWRTLPRYDRDDLMQELYVVFMKLEEAYPEVRTPSHFMALFKVSARNKIIHLANARTREQVKLYGTEGEPEVPIELDQLGEAEDPRLSDLFVKCMFEDAPAAIKDLIKQLRSQGVDELKYNRRRDGTRPTTNELLNELAGNREPVDFQTLIHVWINGEQPCFA